MTFAATDLRCAGPPGALADAPADRGHRRYTPDGDRGWVVIPPARIVFPLPPRSRAPLRASLTRSATPTLDPGALSGSHGADEGMRRRPFRPATTPPTGLARLWEPHAGAA